MPFMNMGSIPIQSTFMGCSREYISTVTRLRNVFGSTPKNGSIFKFAIGLNHVLDRDLIYDQRG